MNRKTILKLAIVTFPFLLLLFFTFAEKNGDSGDYHFQ